MKKKLLLKIFDAAYMQRWNDKLRPIPLLEIDKQAHKMMIAYFLGKFEEQEKAINWLDIIEGFFFEFLQRMVITDIKPFIFDRIKQDREKYCELNGWIMERLLPFIEPLGESFCLRCRSYFDDDDNTVEKRILNAAHLCSSRWEFDILERANPTGYDIDKTKKAFTKKMENYYDLRGIKELALYNSYRMFIDLCGQLRYQTRWSNLHRFPKTSVLGHCFYVAVTSYLFSRRLESCPQRIFNNFFSGLFHDLPEVLTRDIISPVKKSINGLSELIKEYEVEEMEREVYPLLPPFFHDDLRRFTEDEFSSYVILEGKKVDMESEEISKSYNENRYSPRDGLLVKAADELAAFIEAYSAIKNGSNAEGFSLALNNIREKYLTIGNIGGIDMKELYSQFE